MLRWSSERITTLPLVRVRPEVVCLRAWVRLKLKYSVKSVFVKCPRAPRSRSQTTFRGWDSRVDPQVWPGGGQWSPSPGGGMRVSERLDTEVGAESRLTALGLSSLPCRTGDAPRKGRVHSGGLERPGLCALGPRTCECIRHVSGFSVCYPVLKRF